MRVDGVAPRTWLLAVVAGWALLLWMLALLGLGERIGRLPDDPSLNKPLPRLAATSPERLGPLTQYAETSARPLFSDDRRPQPFSLQPEGEEAKADTFDYLLTSVLITPGLHMAIVQPSAGGESIRIKLGEAAEDVPAWRLVALNPRSAIFEGPEGQRTLELRIFDGVGGQAPTSIRAPTPEMLGGSPARRPVQREPSPSPRPATTPVPEPQVLTDAVDAPPADAADAQVDAIRKRIEARRAQLRSEAEQPAKQVKNP